nr:MAG TPA: hypothetical protein [Caudoviricetes sp.]
MNCRTNTVTIRRQPTQPCWRSTTHRILSNILFCHNIAYLRGKKINENTSTVFLY